jgi:hypothetical protein
MSVRLRQCHQEDVNAVKSDGWFTHVQLEHGTAMDKLNGEKRFYNICLSMHPGDIRHV